MSSIFLKPTRGGKSVYTARAAALRSHFLSKAIVVSETSGGLYGERDAIIEIEVPVHGSALASVMQHCERHHKAAMSADLTKAADADDRAFIDELDGESLLRLAGAAHFLGVLPLLLLAAQRIAEGFRTPGPPWDELIAHTEPGMSLNSDERAQTATEFIFTPPGLDGAPPADVGACNASGVQPVPAASAGPSERVSKQNGGSMAALMLQGQPVQVSAPTPAAPAAVPASTPLPFGGRLIELIGSEEALAACLERLDTQTLQQLKPLSRTWRWRARRALCSGAWREHARVGEVLDFGSTYHWSREERCNAARFISDGGCARLTVLRADGFEAKLPPLLQREVLGSPQCRVTAGAWMPCWTPPPTVCIVVSLSRASASMASHYSHP